MTHPEKLKAIVTRRKESKHAERICSELTYLDALSALRGGTYDEQLEQAADLLLARIADDGVITAHAVAETESALSDLAPAAKSLKEIFVAHAHIDMNWQWGYNETAAITVDTFRTMLALMREYPDFTFAQSQASTYEIIEKYRPDFVINSVHGVGGRDYARYQFVGDKKEIYGAYLKLVRKSLDAPYPYDIVGHIGYIARYVPFADRRLGLEEFGDEIDDILKTIIEKGKILEVNSANKTLENRTLPAWEIVERYFALGGRKVSFGSDAHFVERIADKREEIVETLKKIGFEYVTVPFRGEHIEVKL